MSERTIGAFEAKTHLSRLLDEVEKGDSVTITKHGRPVARLVPAGQVTLRRTGPAPRRFTPEELAAFQERYRAHLDLVGKGLSREEIVALVREGRDG